MKTHARILTIEEARNPKKRCKWCSERCKPTPLYCSSCPNCGVCYGRKEVLTHAVKEIAKAAGDGVGAEPQIGTKM